MRKKINKKKATKWGKCYFNKKIHDVGLGSIFTFGKYKGMSISCVCDEDPNYISWCARNTILKFDKEVREYLVHRKASWEENERLEKEVKEEELRRRKEAWRQASKAWNNFIRNRDREHTQTERFHPSEPRQAEVKIPTPAAQWDHLPDKQKHGHVLGIQGGTRITKQAIRALYKKRMLEYHPDKCASLGEEIKKLSHEMTVRVNKAYEYFQRVYGV